jgi:hypothetical protein
VLGSTLKAHFMPWTAPTGLQQVAGWISLIAVPIALSTFFFPIMVVPCLIICLALGGLVVVYGVKGFHEGKRDARRTVSLLFAHAAFEGRIPLDELPPEIQEQIKIEHARLHLGDQP